MDWGGVSGLVIKEVTSRHVEGEEEIGKKRTGKYYRQKEGRVQLNKKPKGLKVRVEEGVTGLNLKKPLLRMFFGAIRKGESCDPSISEESKRFSANWVFPSRKRKRGRSIASSKGAFL